MRKDILRGGQRKYLQLQNNNIPNTAYLQDYNGKDIQGTFYEQELQKTTQDVYRIEKVIKSKGNKFKVVVKWKGHPADEFNSWIDKNELIACYRFVRVVRGIYLT